MTRDRVLIRAFRVVALIYFVTLLAGVRTRYIGMATFPLLAAAWVFAKDRATFLNRALVGGEKFERSTGIRRAFLVFTVAALVAVPLSSLFYYGALTLDLWDWGSYLQGIYNGAFHGVMSLTPMDVALDARQFHPSIGIPILNTLYRIFPDWIWVVAWHGFFLAAPAVVFTLGLREILKRANIPADALTECLCVFAFLFSPVVSGNYQWAYHWHIAGMLFFALAFYAYSRGQLGYAFICLAIFAAHKEEFGLFAGALGVPMLLDSRFPKGKRIAYGFAILVGGVAVFRWGSAQANSSFRDRFGNLGQTPSEALINLVVDPIRYWRAWTAWPSLRFMLYFFVASFWFLAPSRRLFLFALPCLPFLFLYGASDFGNMHEFRHHYAHPLQIGLFATLIFGLLPSLIKKPTDLYRARAIFIAFLTLSAFWAQDTSFRSLYTGIQEFYGHRADRAFLAGIKPLRDDIICCENRLCTYLSDRPIFIFADECLKGSKMLGSRAPSRVGFLVHEHTVLKDRGTEPLDKDRVRIRFPENWDYRSDYMKFTWVVPGHGEKH